jgi:hypothetical protein
VKRNWSNLDVGLILGSLLNFLMGLILGWEVFGGFGGLAVGEERVADKTARWPYFILACRIRFGQNWTYG